MLTLYPAIDLKDGACVRLRRGDMAEATVFSDDPAGQAAAFEKEGARWLHVVDLNGAFAGYSVNEAAVAAILKAVHVPVQLGGGIRDLGAIEAWLAAGGTAGDPGLGGGKNPELVREACRKFPSRIVVGIDARDGFAATEGWARTSTMKALDLALRFEDAGVAAIIYTDIARDGMLSGLNLEQTFDLACQLSTRVIASGGVGGIEDLRALRLEADKHPGAVEGVIVGRALYDGRISVKDALEALARRA